MSTNSRKTAEKELYEPIRGHLTAFFDISDKSSICWLDNTAGGVFSDTLKKVVPHDIIFAFLGKKASPDLTGFMYDRNYQNNPFSMHGVKNYITVEIKKEKVTLQDIYQAKMYGDLFQAKYALLISPEPIPEEMRRLDQHLFITYRYMTGWRVYIGEWSSKLNLVARWFPHPPLQD